MVLVFVLLLVVSPACSSDVLSFTRSSLEIAERDSRTIVGR